MKKFFLVALLLAHGISVTGATGVTVSGRVTEMLFGFGFTPKVILTKGTESRDAILEADGSFKFSMVPPGTYMLSSNPKPVGTQPMTIFVGEKDVTGILYVFPARQTIPVHVTIQGGGPMPYFSIGVTVNGESDSGTYDLAVRAGDDGMSRISIPVGVHRLTVKDFPPAYVLQSFRYGSMDLRTASLELPTGESSEIVVTFGLHLPESQRWVGVSGLVIGVSDVEMMADHTTPTQITLSGQFGNLHATMGLDGTFEFPEVPPGSYQTKVVANVVGVAPVTVLVSDEAVNNVQIVVPHQRQLTGHVVIENGGPRPRLFFSLAGSNGTMIGLNPVYNTDGSFTMMAADGDYTIKLAGYPASYILKSITSGSTNLSRQMLKIHDKDTPEIVVTMQSGKLVKVKGHVVNPPKPRKRDSIRVVLGGPAIGLGSAVKADGSFEIRDVPAGEYTAWVTPGTGATSGTRIVVTDKDLNDVRITTPP